ncbi:MAG: putative transrane anti-sigma factor [Bryobacterales bacterium]|nr:putative transrane anti-sigma factor [Bryobacterales bacterium]
MNCADVEILLADYVDETLRAEEKFALEAHLAGCAACAELARDCAAAVAFMERAAEVQAPPEMVTRILFELTAGPSRAVIKPSLGRRLFGRWLEPVLQPRFAMGMAMTVLSFAMIGRFTQVRQLTPADLDPVKVWTAAEDRVVRWYNRGVKYYDSLRVVYEIQTRLKEWADEQPQAGSPAPVSDTTQSKPAGETK